MTLEQMTEEQLETLMVVVNAIEDVGYEGDDDMDFNRAIINELLDKWMYVVDRSYSSVYKFVTDKYSYSLKDKIESFTPEEKRELEHLIVTISEEKADHLGFVSEFIHEWLER
jgi:hypothetical protein